MRFRPGPRALWFVRHGQSEGNVAWEAAEADHAERFALGTRDADVPLSALGRRQAAAVGHWLSEQPPALWPTAVLVSPYLRTRQTADLLIAAAREGGVGALPVEVDERLRDREMGRWEGLTWRGVQVEHPEDAARAVLSGRYYHRPLGGESWADIALRLRSLLVELRQVWPGERVLVVSHDVTIQLTRCLLEGHDEAGIVRLLTSVTYANCAVSSFEAMPSFEAGPTGPTGPTAEYRRTAYNAPVPVQEHGEPVTEERDAGTAG